MGAPAALWVVGARVRVEAEGEVGGSLGGLEEGREQGGQMGELGAVEEEGADRQRGELGDEIEEGLAAEELAVGAADDGEPDRQSGGEGGFAGGVGLVDAADGLDEQEVAAGLGEVARVRSMLEEGALTRGRALGGEAVLEGWDRAGDDGAPGGGIGGAGELAGLAGEMDGEVGERAGSLAEAGRGEVARVGAEGVGGDHLRAGAQVFLVDLADEVGGVKQGVSGPEGGAEAGAPALELRAHGAVEQDGHGRSTSGCSFAGLDDDIGGIRAG